MWQTFAHNKKKEAIVEILGTVIGGLIALVGSVGVQIYVLRYTLKTKMDEAVAARKVTANGEAYRNIKRIEGALVQQSIEDTHALIMGLEQWFFDNRLFLPGDFPNHWLTARTNIGLLAMNVPNRPIEQTESAQKKVDIAIAGAIAEIYKDSGIKQPEWDRFSDRNAGNTGLTT